MTVFLPEDAAMSWSESSSSCCIRILLPSQHSMCAESATDASGTNGNGHSQCCFSIVGISGATKTM